jgi:hypothetical protein
MRYEAVISDRAFDTLARMPGNLADFVLSQIEELEANPVELSERASFPYPHGQVYWLECSQSGVHYDIVVFFRYAQGERHLLITSIDYVGLPE